MAFVDAFGPSALAVADSLVRQVEAFPLDGELNDQQWPALAEQGIFAIDDLFPEERNSVICAAMEVLGRRGLAPAHAAAGFAFVRFAPADLRASVMDGAARVSMGALPYMPFASARDIFVIESDGVAMLLAPTRIEPVETLSSEGWVRVEGAPSSSLGPFASVHDVYDLALSAWFVGAGLSLLDATVSHAQTRRQFGHAIGEFQAVAGPLARAAVGLDAARALVLTAAAAADGGDMRLAPLVRHSSSRAASEAALVSHQTFGALGMVEQGPVQARSKRIRQLMSQQPAARRVDPDVALLPGRSLSFVAGAVTERSDV